MAEGEVEASERGDWGHPKVGVWPRGQSIRTGLYLG